MTEKLEFLIAGEAAHRLGVSPKTLRLYEQHGLIKPGRTGAGWRAYGPADMERAQEIVAFRKLGLSLAQISELLQAETQRDNILAEHQGRLQSQIHALGAALRNVRTARSTVGGAVDTAIPMAASFDLPWPWAGERFELPPVLPLTYITGPLGSGKTRLAMRLAEALPGGSFLGLDRLDAEGSSYAARLGHDARLQRGCDPILRLLELDGATISPALTALIAALCAAETLLVIDMVEQGLDRATQLALSRYLRHRDYSARPLFLMTRSSAILDLSIAESGETIIYCPANHNPPMIVHPDPLCPGYESVDTCLATPEVRSRTAVVIAAWATDATAAAT